MLKEKYYTTPLLLPTERVPLIYKPVQKPTLFRIFHIGSHVIELLSFILRLRFAHKKAPRETAVKIRGLFEILGGMWIKLGQVMSMRNDLFSPEFCDELLKLQDRAFGFSPELSKQLIEAQIKCPIANVFDQFEEEPFAAASLSQVHKAKLRGQEIWVAVKVQRPFAMETFRYDFWWLSLFFNLLEQFHVAENFHWCEMTKEIKGFMEEELDYRHEASEMKKLRKIFRDHGIYVPKVFLKYTTRTLLVTEFLPGVFMSDFVKVSRSDPHRISAWLDQNELNPKKLARRLLQSMMRQMFEDYAFHGDLHPGNIMLLRKNRIALIDFGNTGNFDHDFIARYDQYSRALSAGNFSTAADMFLLFAGSIPSVDTTQVKKDVVAALQEAQRRSSIQNLPFHERSLASTSAEINAIVLKYKFDMNWSLLKMARTFAALDQTIGVLYPEIDYVKETRRFYVASEIRRKTPVSYKISQFIEKVSDLANVVMPMIASRAINFKGTMTHGVRFVAFCLKLVSYALCIGFVVAFWTYLYQHHRAAVQVYHNHGGAFARWVENRRDLPKTWWWWIIILLGVSTYKLRRFLQRLYKPPVRLPGHSHSTHS